MTEQDARYEAKQLAVQAGVNGDWFIDVMVAKLMRWYHQGAVDAIDKMIKKLGPRGETNAVRTLQDGERIVP